MGPLLAHFYPGLPNPRTLSLLDIVAYLRWRADFLDTKPKDDEE